MEKDVLLFSEKCIQEASDCLKEMGDELDRMVDLGRYVYKTARIKILKENFKIDGFFVSSSEAEELLREMDTKNSVQSRIAQVKDTTLTTLQKTPWDYLITEELIGSYKTFCEENGFSPSSIPLVERTDEIIYWFNDQNGGQHTISWGSAYKLLNDMIHDDHACQDYLERVYYVPSPLVPDKESM